MPVPGTCTPAVTAEYDGRVQNGGHYHYLYSVSVERAEELSRSLMSLGAPDHSRVLTSALDAWSNSDENDEESLRMLDDSLEESGDLYYPSFPSLVDLIESQLDNNQTNHVEIREATLCTSGVGAWLRAGWVGSNWEYRMAQWIGQFSGKTHLSKVQDCTEMLRHAVAVRESKETIAARKTCDKDVFRFADRLFIARLRAVKAQLAALDPRDERGYERTRQKITQLVELGTNAVLDEFGVADVVPADGVD